MSLGAQAGVVLGCFAAMDSDESGAFAGQICSAMATRREPPTPNPQPLTPNP